MIREFNNPELAPRNSFHVAQRAARLIEFDRTEDLQELFEKGMPDPWYVLGGGNNVLFTQDYPGTLLTPVAQGIRIVDEQPDCVTVEADAGVEWDDLVKWAVQHELWGLENLSLIPGKVGAAPVQNIGAYGCEAKDAIRSVEMFCTETFNTLVLNREHCAFGYRDSVFKRSLRGRVIITSVRFALSRTPRPRLEYGDLAAAVEARGGITLRNIREAVCAIRRAKLPDPAVTGNAGSFFKNPVVGREEAERLSALYPDMPHYPAADRRLADRPRRTERPQRRTRRHPPPAGAGDYQPRRRYGYGDRRFRPQSAGTGKETLRRGDRTRSQYIIKPTRHCL